ncbi:hypothetical protein [Nonomuraea sp. JJY05]
MRPEFANAMDYARTIKQAVPYQRVIGPKVFDDMIAYARAAG